MSFLHSPLARNPASIDLHGAMKTLAREAAALLDALAHPGRILADVDAMRVLLVAANARDADDPAAAAALRRQASRIGL